MLAGELDTLTLQTAEDELIDDYLLGSITREERCGFEEQFLITRRARTKAQVCVRTYRIFPKEPS